jgi:hypothetical protein
MPIPPNSYSGLLFFVMGSAGWTEKYYLLGSNLTAAAANLVAVANARFPILHSDGVILTGTISEMSTRGDSTTVFSIPKVGTAVDTAGWLQTDVAVLVKWQVGVYNRNKTFVRGIPVGQTGANEYIPTLTFIGLMSTYLSAVVANCQMPITSVNPTPPPARTITSFMSITNGAPAAVLHRRKSGRPFGLPRGRRVAP